MFATIAAVAGLAAVVHAQDALLLQFNASQSAPTNGYDTWRDAESRPNITHDVTFDRWNNTDDGRNWTWSIGITDVYRPNLTVAVPGQEQRQNTSNISVALSTYSFSWPGERSLNAAAADGNPRSQFSTNAEFGPSCFYLVHVDFPQNVSDAWDSSSSSCTSAIGDECVQAIKDGFTGVDCDSGNFPSLDVSRNAACSGSFGAATSGLAINAYQFGNASAAADGSEFESGDVYGWILSDPYKPENHTAFEAEANKLRMVVLTDVTQNIIGRDVLCNRAGPGSSNGRSDSAGVKLARVTLWPAIFVTLAAIAVCIYN